MKVCFREVEVERLSRLIDAGESVVVHGEAGTGKRSVVEEYFRRSGKRCMELRMTELILQSGSALELQDRLEEELRLAREGGMVVYIPRAENLKVIEDGGCKRLFRTQSEQNPRLIRPICDAILQSRMQCICTSSAYESVLSRVSAFAACFETMKVCELRVEETVQALSANMCELEAVVGVSLSEGAVRRAVELSHRYFTRQRLPLKAVELIEEVSRKYERCQQADVEREVSSTTRLPLMQVQSGFVTGSLMRHQTALRSARAVTPSVAEVPFPLVA
mmetsp:Transcript_5591/g.16666  ORF Transcript_5591/g.16666 Transcript_5591/m.16666 type:complete len:277 (+) Transcript_5591:62-892(+)